MRASQEESHVIAILVSDLHLSHLPPTARNVKGVNWYEVMERYLNQVQNKARFYDNAPIICAGDIFDKWNSPPELINFAMKIFGQDCDWYCIPGQHDLPYHRYEDMHKSAYGSLVQAGAIQNLDSMLGLALSQKKLIVDAFPWGTELKPVKEDKEGYVYLAVVHKYIWKQGHTHPGAKPEDHVNVIKKQLEGYDAALFGDNHSGFIRDSDREGNPFPFIYNSGSFIRRRTDERDYQTTIGLLHSDGQITREKLDTSEDVFAKGVSDEKPEDPRDLEIAEFLGKLADLGDKALDFAAMMKKVAKDQDPEVRRVILEALEKARES